MRQYTKYKRLRPRTRRVGGMAGGALLLVALGLASWHWWPPRGPTETQPNGSPAKTTAPTSGPATTPAHHPAPTRQTSAPQDRQPPASARKTNTVKVSTPPPAPAKTVNEPRPTAYPRPVRNVFEAQLALARQGLSPGSIDGVLGRQTRAALEAFQRKEKLPATGRLNPATVSRLVLTTPPVTEYTVTAADLARLEPLSPTWLGKSKQDRLDYQTVLEEVAEKGEAYPSFIRRLNPDVDWNRVTAGTRLKVPQVGPPDVAAPAAFVRIQLSSRTLEAYDTDAHLLAHFPCSIARFANKRPVGELHVVSIVQNPVYVFDPTNFPESPEAQAVGRKLTLPPGPNNPVGLVWIGLDKPGYGIHGTPQPEHVGRTESHGCFRLANWNAEFLSRLVRVGTPVFVEP